MKSNTHHFHMFALSIWDKGYSGGDRILVELARRFMQRGHEVDIYTWARGEEIFTREKLSGEKLHIFHLQKWLKMGFTFHYLIRIVSAVIFASFVSKDKFSQTKKVYLYCSSDFWMDSLPCLILKIRFPKLQWIATYYLTAPNPFRGFKENGELRMPTLNGSIYWLQQQVVIPAIKKYADYLFVTSAPDAHKFQTLDRSGRTVIVYGGVDLSVIKNSKKKYSKLPKIHDAIFMGRFHPQKGVIELITIWKNVVEKKKNATLVMIGDGDLMPEVKRKITELGLEKNIILKGYVLDGDEKYRLFNQSKLFLHPAIYDSGGMSAAEAMAWGLPAVSFDIESLRTYYPFGMVKVPLGDNDAFSSTIIKLLNNSTFYKKVSEEAKNLIETEWDWDNRAKVILEKLDGTC